MDFEKLGAFYLGKTYNLKSQKLGDELVMYDARDLTTHAVCVGMTGSGKTGLCLDLLEEAAIDRVPAIIVDPKGDITNLLLTFPDLRPEDFRPWINADDARRKGLSEDEFAAKQAETWRSGLAEWGQDGERIRRLRETADFVIYTPGSDAGVPVSILQSFAAPSLSWDDDAELLRERVQGTVSALLGLVGVEADPVRSREHILLSNIFEHFWRKGEDLDLPKLILSIQTPPIRQLGVFDVDTFFPQKDRFELAMMLNNIIAAPSFQSWLQGQSLDIAGFLSTPDGKPRHAVFYIAHLSDAERMFFVTMLLNQLVTWMRTQPGTTSLRALFYMDEIFGFFPPIANPPSKLPLLTLLKQARAFGLGCVLTTQNPADLDYKGLTNAGTWFIGRLQAERDKERLLDGLESASAQAGEALDRAALSKIVSGLGSRVFLLHNVHEEAPVIFQTRWAMSYLRGPLTRTQVRKLMGEVKPDQAAAAPKVVTAATSAAPAASAAAVPAATAVGTASTVPPALPAGIQQVYLPLKVGAAAADLEVEKRAGGQVAVQSRKVFYSPALLGMGQVHFTKQSKGLNVDESNPFALLAQPPSGVGGVAWDEAQSLDLTPRDLIDRAEPESCFDVLPERMNEAREFTALQKDLEDHLYRTSSLTLFYSPAAKVYSEPGEDLRAFKARLTQEARELRDAEVDKLEERYSSKLKTLEERLRKAKATLAKKEADARTRKQDALLTAGETIIGLFVGRRRSLSSAATKVSRASTANIDVDAAEEQIEAVQQEMQTLQEALKQETDAIVAQWDAALEKVEEVSITPRRTDVEMTLFVLAWMPHWQIAYKSGSVTQTATIAAY